MSLDTRAAHPKCRSRSVTIHAKRGKATRGATSHFVEASGLRWLSLMLLAPASSAGRVWALPFLTALAPSELYCRERGCQHKKLTDWAHQLVLQARHCLPGRDIVLMGDNGFAALELLATLTRHKVTGITRLRLDAALYYPAPVRLAGTNGRPRTKGARLPSPSNVLGNIDATWRLLTVQGWYGEGERAAEVCPATAVWRHGGMPIVPIRWVLVRDPRHRFDLQALLCTDQRRTPEQILGWFVQRWQPEVTFQETRTHLGVETRRQWSDLAIERPTPCLLGLFLLATLLAARLRPTQRKAAADSAWYRNRRPTFSATLAAVRRHIQHIRQEQGLLTSRRNSHVPKPCPALSRARAHALCHAAYGESRD